MDKIKSIIIVPGWAEVTTGSNSGTVKIPIRTDRRLDAFAEALHQLLQIPVAVCEEPVPTPGDGTVVLCRPDVLIPLASRGTTAYSWVVVVDLIRTQVVTMAEKLGLAATIERPDFENWVCEGKHRPMNLPVNQFDDTGYESWVYGVCAPPALYGRKELAPLIAASPSTHVLHSTPRYCRMKRSEGDLPTLLADYLKEYEKIFLT